MTDRKLFDVVAPGERLVFPESSCVIVLDDRRNLILVEQHRAVLSRTTIELPGGKRDENESIEECATRELREETGITCTALRKVMTLDLDTSVALHKTHVFYGFGCASSVIRARHDAATRLVCMDLDHALKRVRDGSITHAPTVASVLWLACDSE